MVAIRFILSLLLIWASLHSVPAENRRIPLATDEVIELPVEGGVQEMKLGDPKERLPLFAGATTRRMDFRCLSEGGLSSGVLQAANLPLRRPLFLLYHRMLFYG